MSGFMVGLGEVDLGQFVRSIQDLFKGRSNCAGSFTCATGAATTVVTAPNCGPNSKVILQAETANAAAEVGAGTIYVSAKGVNQFTVTHANSATTGRTFAYRIVS